MWKNASLVLVICSLSGCSLLVNRFAFFPDSMHAVPLNCLPDTIKFVTIKTVENLQLGCFYLPQAGSRKVVIYFHGDGGNLDQRLPELVTLRNFGINVLGVGYRGYGRSQSHPSEPGIC
jgi:hypothetical protein